MSVVTLREALGGRLHREAVCLRAEVGGGLRVVLADGRGGMVSGAPVAEFVATAMIEAPDDALPATLSATHLRVASRNADPSEAAHPWVAMTCSVAAVHLRGDHLRVVQVGDVRVYHLAARGALTRLTTDQTLAALQGAADAPWGDPRASFRTILLDPVGGERPPTVTTREIQVSAGDRVLITSSALPRRVPDAALGACLTLPFIEGAADALRDLGLDALARCRETGNISLAVIAAG